jgi:hypothetical protein
MLKRIHAEPLTRSFSHPRPLAAHPRHSAQSDPGKLVVGRFRIAAPVVLR